MAVRGQACADPGNESSAQPPSEAIRSLLSALDCEFARLQAENRSLQRLVQQIPQENSVSIASEPVASQILTRQPSAPGPASAYACRVQLGDRAAIHDHDDRTAGGVAASMSNVSQVQPQLSDVRRHRTEGHVEDEYEKFYDLSRAFNMLCARRRASISVGELVQMSANQQGISPLDEPFAEVRPRFEAAVKALNANLGITAGIASKEPAKEVTLDSYIAIMQAKEQLFSTGPSDILESIQDVRDILLKEDAFRKVARATNTTTDDIYAASRHITRQNRMDKCIKYLDPVIGLVIILNAIVICISTDVARDSKVWDWVELSFALVFVAELAIKIAAHGPGHFFFGHDMCWNLFDAAVVLVAVVDIAFTVIGTATTLGNSNLVRLLKFARLTRLVRVLKLKVFKELTLMINGLLVGFRTLVWAIVFLGFILFAVGVMCTQTIGHQSAASWDQACAGRAGSPEHLRACSDSASHLALHGKELFGNVFRSMFTVFRCFTDGCSSVDGTPLIPYIYNTLGGFVVLLYMIVILFVIFGLFNLIMAIFVENTIANSKLSDAKRKEARENEHLQVARKLQEVIVMFCTGGHDDEDADDGGGSFRFRPMGWFRSAFATGTTEKCHDDVDLFADKNLSNLSLQVTKPMFDKVIDMQQVTEMLDDLDIASGSRHGLFEVLDANGNGTLEVGELVQGLLKLRGSADKGDAVASLLGIRSIQKSIKALEVLSLHQQQAIEGIGAAQDHLGSALDVAGGAPAPSASTVRRASSRDTFDPKGAAKKGSQCRLNNRLTVESLRMPSHPNNSQLSQP